MFIINNRGEFQGFFVNKVDRWKGYTTGGRSQVIAVARKGGERHQIRTTHRRVEVPCRLGNELGTVKRAIGAARTQISKTDAMPKYKCHDANDVEGKIR